MCLRVHVCSACSSACGYVCLRVHVCTYAYVDTCTHRCGYVYARMSACEGLQLVHMHTHARTHVYTHITDTSTRTRAHTHKHTLALDQPAARSPLGLHARTSLRMHARKHVSTLEHMAAQACSYTHMNVLADADVLFLAAQALCYQVQHCRK